MSTDTVIYKNEQSHDVKDSNECMKLVTYRHCGQWGWPGQWSRKRTAWIFPVNVPFRI